MLITREAIGQRVRKARRDRNLSQRTLATACGCDYPVISNLERGRQSVGAERLGYIAHALGVSADYLLGLVSEEQSHV
jgi:transcriptional regulator with XRE-family HTH domain